MPCDGGGAFWGYCPASSANRVDTAGRGLRDARYDQESQGSVWELKLKAHFIVGG